MEPVLKRYAKVYELPMSVVREHERELKRYLTMCIIREPGVGSYGVRGEVDELWHMFLIFTKPYSDFCETVAGRFIHHSPTETSKGNSHEKYARTLRAYESIFGEPAPAHIWPALRESDDTSSSSSSEDIDNS